MSSGQAYAADEARDYERLCSKYGEKMRDSSRHHLEQLQCREANENEMRTAKANANNVERYLRDATNRQLRNELNRRGLK